jgi:hypothetical protein
VSISLACVGFVDGMMVGAKRTVDRERRERNGDGGRRGRSESGVGKREDGAGECVSSPWGAGGRRMDTVDVRGWRGW